MTRHPTPADIRYHISLALREDQQHGDPRDLPIPVRTTRLINEAINRACDEAAEQPMTYLEAAE